jgi:hypothetical protein
MPRNYINKEIAKMEVLKLKRDIDSENVGYFNDPKELAHKYLNKILDKLDEYRH